MKAPQYGATLKAFQTMRPKTVLVACMLALWNENITPTTHFIRPCAATTPQLLPPLRRPDTETSIAARKIRGGEAVWQTGTKNENGTETIIVARKVRGGEAAWQSGIKNSMASALAAASSKLLLAPLDTIKTLQQSQRATGQAALTLGQAARIILERPKGFLELYAGIGVAMFGAMPSVGLYFGIYSFCKKTFYEWDPYANSRRQTIYIALSAAIGNAIASASRVPYEVMKQKLQTKVYESVGEALRDMSMRALFPVGGIASQMLRDIPYAVVTLLTYEHLKQVWKPKAEELYPTVPKRSWDLLVGGLAGGIGSYLTNPMDVIKTRLQTDGSGGSGGISFYGGSIVRCATLTWEEGGLSAFLRGSVPRLLHKVPANAFFFLFYELFRSLLNVHDDTVEKSS